VTSTEVLDPDALQSWLGDVLGAPLAHLDVELLPQGHANGAWRIVADTVDGPRRMVLKAPRDPSIVHQLDPCREARVVDALARAGAPVPRVVAIDPTTNAVGRPCFVMEWVEGRSVADAWPNAYHDGWFLDAGPEAQRAIWDSFHDALAAVHRVDLDVLASAYDGPRGAVDVLQYWRAALLDLVPPAAAPRHLAIFDWLLANLPTSADAPSALCMGDARLVNAIIDDADVRALVDFEVAYVGNPAADIGYSLFLERSHAHTTPLPGLPTEEETWSRWSAATGRELTDRDYWMAYGATIIVVTATRASVMWGPPDSFSEDHQGLLPLWESVVGRASK
jgi:aminoglycoside phosphotransferase (APT) family kinase protein